VGRPPTIVIEKLCKTFNGQLVLDQLDLEIPAGKTTVIIGKSGEGKSVLLKHLIGLLRPDEGEIYVDGQPLSRLNDREINALRRHFGFVFQDAALFDYLTVEENVAFPLYQHTDLNDAAIAAKVREKLAEVGLTEALHKAPSELSGGMRKRVGLARALVLEPEVMLYDEPTTGLDPIIGAQITELLGQTQRQRGLTGVVISHNLSTTFALADKIAMLSGGRMVASGTVEEFRNSRHPLVREFLEKGSFS
jgi:phospholipid/cholesterol/gamma-HCH transport system ATP-binding protein